MIPPGPLYCVLGDRGGCVTVLEVHGCSKLKGKAKIGDVIASINGKQFATTAECVQFLMNTESSSRVVQIQKPTDASQASSTCASTAAASRDADRALKTDRITVGCISQECMFREDLR